MNLLNKGQDSLFKGKYRSESARLQGFDYGSDGGYFLTICTKDRENYFGEIRNGIMRLNELGCIAHEFWQEIPRHFPNAILDEFVLMPNHVHGILILDDSGRGGAGVGTGGVAVCRDAINRVSTKPGPAPEKPGPAPEKPGPAPTNKTTTTENGGIVGIHNPMGTGKLGEIVRWFKGRTTFEIRKNHDFEFAWQPRFHDRIVRNEQELDRIRRYIRNNPLKWELDRNNPNNLHLPQL